MAQNPYAAYLESSILTAEPLELVRRLYAAALDSVVDAQGHLAAGRIRERGDAVSKACSILLHLRAVVNSTPDEALARNLVELYDYMQRRLTYAHVHKAAEPLKEVASILRSLGEAWQQIEPGSAAANASGSRQM